MNAYDIFWALMPFDWRSGWTPLVWLAAAFFAFMSGLFLFLWQSRIRVLRRRAGDLEGLLASLKGAHALPIRAARVWDDEVATRVAALPYLTSAVGAFRKQCWTIGEEIRRAHTAAQDFSMDRIDPKHARVGDAIPGLLTALGILGTFVGITIGLGQIGAAGLSDSTAPAQEQATRLSVAIGHLVASLGVSFGTSIWGLLFSISGTVLVARAEERLSGALGALIDWIDRAVERGTEQGLLVQVVEVQGKQLSELQGLAGAITEGFEKAINGGDGGGGLAGLMRDISANVAKSQSEGVEGLVEHFISEMHSKLGSRFGELGGSINTMVTANAAYQSAMQGIVGQLTDAGIAQRNAAAAAEASVQRSMDAVREIGATVTALHGSADAIGEVSRTVASLLERQTGAIGRQEALSAGLVEALRVQEGGWRAHQQAIAGSYEAIQGRFDALGAAVGSLVDWHDRVKVALGEQVDSWLAAVQVQREITTQFGSERAKTVDLLKGLESASRSFDTLGTGLQQLADQLQSQIGDAQAVQSSGARTVAEAAAHLDQVGRTLGQSWSEYEQVARELSAALPNITGLLQSIVDSVDAQKQVVVAGREIAQQMRQSTDAQQQIRAGFESIVRAGEATRLALQPVAAAIAGGASSLERAGQGLEASAAGVKGLADGLRSAVDGLSEQQREAARVWGQVSTGVERTTNQLNIGMRDYSEKVNVHLKGALNEFDKTLQQAVSSLGSAIGSLQDVVDAIPNNDRDNG